MEVYTRLSHETAEIVERIKNEETSPKEATLTK